MRRELELLDDKLVPRGDGVHAGTSDCVPDFDIADVAGGGCVKGGCGERERRTRRR